MSSKRFRFIGNLGMFADVVLYLPNADLLVIHEAEAMEILTESR
jgi:hypothetical protein